MWMNTVDEGSVQWQTLNYSFHTIPPNPLIFYVYIRLVTDIQAIFPQVLKSPFGQFSSQTLVQRSNFLPHN